MTGRSSGELQHIRKHIRPDVALALQAQAQTGGREMSRYVHSSWGSYKTRLPESRPVVRYFNGKEWRDGQIEDRNGALAWIRDVHSEEGSWRDRWEIE